MKMKYGVTLALVAALLGTAPALATDYWVATTGNDSNPGTQASPFLTLWQAASVATPGTTVHVAPGTYSSSLYCNTPDVTGQVEVCMTTSGTASAPITLAQRIEANPGRMHSLGGMHEGTTVELAAVPGVLETAESFSV